MDEIYYETFLDDEAHAEDSSDYSEDLSSEGGDASELDNDDTMDVDNDIARKVRTVIDVMESVGLNLISFLDAVSWGDPECIADAKIRAQRSALMTSKTLPSILHRWWHPPRSKGSKDRRPAGARLAMESFASDCMKHMLSEELHAVASLFQSDLGGYDVSEKELTGIVFQEVISRARQCAPTLWAMLYNLACSSKQHARNTHKNPDKVILLIFSMLAYMRSHRNSRFQKFFAVYFKFRGLSAKGFDTLHALAITMSHKWTCNAVARISKLAMDEMHELKGKFPWLLSYDNVNIPFRVFSQRLDNQGEFGNGTAATVYIKRSAIPLSPSANRSLQETRLVGMKNPLTELDIFNLMRDAFPRVQTQMKYQVLKFLIDSPQFDMHTYRGRKSSKLHPPTPTSELPCGREHVTLQYLLGTVNIPEASYDDNSRLIKEWLRQLGLNSSESQIELGLEQIIAWIGDQLTIDRLRNLFKFRAEDLNSYDRLDWLILVFGWLHLMMAYANSFHKQYLGTSRGRGLSQAFELLNKKGLGTTATQGPFYHDLNELLYHVAEAHLREDWLAVSGAKSLKELRAKSPDELVSLANRIVDERASSEAIIRWEAKPKPEQDEIFQQTIMFNRDILQYIVLDQAIKHGDIGLMEDSLPQLLCRFVGGKNSNYYIEVLELLQGLQREWPPEIKDFVRQNCWLVNYTGRRADFLPIDQSQEHNIKRIKVTHRSQGPSVDWEYLKKLHPAIHTIEAVGSCAEEEFKTKSRGKKHTIPRKELDVQTLQASYHASEVHKYIRGRTAVSKRDHAKDFADNGAEEIMTGKVLPRWVHGRSFTRATGQEWGLHSSDESNSE